MAKKGYEIKPLDESEYTDTEVNEFSSGDDIPDEVISLDNGHLSGNETPIKIFSFNENQDVLNVGTENSNPKTQNSISHNTNEVSSTNDSSNITSSMSANPSSTPTSKVRGLTPSVDGESFSVKRCYQFRPSTLKKLNQLKGESDNFNIYLNEIIDQAICYYHDYVFNKK
nr:hypothetical protein [Clostridium chromiireducens]